MSFSKMARNNPQKKVIVAMSGGLDSSVAAALLKMADFTLPQGQGNPEQRRRVEVVGVFMKFWAPQSGATRINADKNADLHGFENRCCSTESENRARKVAKILNIPFYVFNFEKEFKKRIVDYFLDGCRNGMTPNPCVVCNKEIKFGLLLEKALKLDADFIATGHYARTNLNWKNLTKNPPGEKVKLRLFKAKDKNKDQSYFLWMLNQKQLKRILFPVGGYTKTEVRNLAKKFRLPLFNIPESMELCFISSTINDFLSRHLQPKPGQIIYSTPGVEYRVIGQHQGLAFYTIGQRKGIGLPGGPYYVLDKDLKQNSLIVTKNERDLYKKELIAKNVNWISGEIPKLPLKAVAKIRYRHKAISAVITKKLNAKRYTLKFDKPQRAVTPGQSVVFYRGEELLGGGIICKE